MRRGAWWVAGWVAMAGCASAVDSPDDGAETSAGFYADSAAPTKAQANELANLGHIDEAAFRPVRHDLQLLRGPSLALADGDPAAAAVAFASANPAIFSGAELRADGVRAEPDGTVVQTSQLAGNRRVLEGAMVFHFDRAGNLVQVAGSAANVGALPDAVVEYPDAEDTARAFLSAQLGAPGVVVADEAVVSGGRGGYRVLVEAVGASGPTRRAIVVDDQTGSVLSDEEELEFVQAQGSGVFGERRSFDASEARGELTLVDETRGQGISTYAWSGGSLPGALVASADGSTWDASGAGRGAAVDAHANSEVVYDFFDAALGRSGLDGRSAPIVSTVHYGQRYDNAFWDGAQVVYGDGDGQSFAPLAGGLDVVAHELTHGVTQFSSKLGGAGQSGALNEAISDAFASFVQLRSGAAADAWKIGAKVYTPGRSGDALRDLSDPQRVGQPDHMTQYDVQPIDASHDNGGIHENSTIAGNAFFLMTMGGTNRTSGRSVSGIGAEHAEHVLYHALTHGLTRTTDFAQCARATEASALELYGAQDADAVRAAWEAVGVRVPPSPLPEGEPVAGDAEPNDSRRAASPLAVGARVTGELESPHDVDYFRFQLDAPADVELTLSGLSSDLDLKLYDASGHVLARSEQTGTHPETITGRAKRGAYYVRVFAPSGSAAAAVGYVLSLSAVKS